jgi:hypothetical protein
MDWTKATIIMGVNHIPIGDLNMKIIKQKYHKLSLLHHPDKNKNAEESKIVFQQINEAYSYFNEIYYYENDELEPLNKDFPFSFSYFLKFFINSLFDEKYCDIVYNIVNDILNNYKSISIQLFDGLEKENCLMIYMFLIKYKTLLHVSNDMIDQIREIILAKYDNVLCYNLNPKINDLFETNIYKLVSNNKIFIVPLWHKEVHFSNDNDQEIIVLCNPILPPNITIDDNNNMIIDYDICFNKVVELLKNNCNIEIEIDVNKIITIELSKLFIKQNQKYILYGAGISTIKDDIYDVEVKSDIIINININ